MVSIIVVAWNNASDLKGCLSSLANLQVPFEVIVVDNASQDNSVEVAKSFPFVRLIQNDTNTLYAPANNQGYAVSKGEYVLLLNQDVVVPAGAIERVVDFLNANPAYGGATLTLKNPDGSIQYYMHRRLPRWYHIPLGLMHKRRPNFKPKAVQQYLYLDETFQTDFDIEQPAGAFVMLRRSVIEQIGGLFNEKLFPLYYNDVEIAYRLKQHGVRLRCLTDVYITHGKGQSIKRLPKWRSLSWYWQSVWRYFTLNWR